MFAVALSRPCPSKNNPVRITQIQQTDFCNEMSAKKKLTSNEYGASCIHNASRKRRCWNANDLGAVTVIFCSFQ